MTCACRGHELLLLPIEQRSILQIAAWRRKFARIGFPIAGNWSRRRSFSQQRIEQLHAGRLEVPDVARDSDATAARHVDGSVVERVVQID
jgi:hypothetical protein